MSHVKFPIPVELTLLGEPAPAHPENVVARTSAPGLEARARWAPGNSDDGAGNVCYAVHVEIRTTKPTSRS